MKKYILSALAICTYTFCHAQAGTMPLVHPMAAAIAEAPASGVPDPLHPYAAQLQGPGSAHKTTAIKSRLKSVSYFEPVGQVFTYTDSLLYEYSGERGGDLTSGKIACDRYTSFEYNTNTNTFSNKSKATYTYNNNDRESKSIIETWVNNAWENSSNMTTTYDAAGNIADEVAQKWDNVNNKWVNTWHYIHSYDGMNNTTLKLTQKWNTVNNVWDNKQQEVYTYNNTTMTSSESKSWDAINSVWKSNNRYEYFYNSNNLLETEKYYIWDANINSLTEVLRYHRTYTTSKLIDVYYAEQENGGSWINYEKQTHSYDASDNETAISHQAWNNNAWEDDSREEYTYDNNNNTTTYLFKVWQKNTNTWLNQVKKLYEYDAVANVTKLTEQQPDMNNNALWVNKTRTMMTYNSYNQLLSSYNEDYIANAWTLTANNSRETYTYEDYTSTATIKQQPSADVTMNVYPNPAAQYLNVDLDLAEATAVHIVLTDITGREVLQANLSAATNHHARLDITGLVPGLYNCIVSTTGTKNTQQVSIVK